MPRIRRTRQARKDLVEILAHLRQYSDAAADRVADAIEQKCQLLAQFSDLGKPRDDLAPGLRSQAVENHVIFFRPLSDGIRVIRILYGARDFPSMEWS